MPDEIFGGYPWFHRKEMYMQNTFPWSYDLSPRIVLFKDDFINSLPLKEYVNDAYETSINQCPHTDGETITEYNRRKISWLNIRWFMMTLLNRMDRCSMYSGLEARVPFADYRILEYVFNVPWEYKCYNNQIKSLLVECGKKYLPPEILYRKKAHILKPMIRLTKNFSELWLLKNINLIINYRNILITTN